MQPGHGHTSCQTVISTSQRRCNIRTGMLPVSIVAQYSAAQFAQSGLRGRRETTCTSARQPSAIDIGMSQALASVSDSLPSPIPPLYPFTYVTIILKKSVNINII